jgi:hypothetical protein
VCEWHQSLPWTGDRRCLCGGAGAPCHACNPSDKDHPPRMPPDFVSGMKHWKAVANWGGLFGLPNCNSSMMVMMSWRFGDYRRAIPVLHAVELEHEVVNANNSDYG